ncbi:hypothetical protein PRUPE_2G283200 [Prunus persica]|uniref:Uncharacterized protein n=1 Tax=Prunus persica TaxID=3760 RepID=A0A251QMU1_PRUPE|nr:hypothetical protein PRUPE_2G283200 [Prunus persica]
MAESVLCFVIEKLVSLLIISTEAKLSRDVRKEVGCIRDELESIQSFLKDADAKIAVEGEMDDSIKTWFRQIREAAYYIEDAIDEYLLCITQHHQDRGFLHKITWLVKKMKPQDEMASKIEAMKTLVSEIKARHEGYGFNSSEQGQSSGEMTVPWHDPRVASLFIEEAQVVGVESARDELINWLVEGASKHELREVIMVLGMGGLGMTTLAKEVYDSQIVMAHLIAMLGIQFLSCLLTLLKICIRLIRLWMAEGLVKSKKGKTSEEVEEEYLTELIHRSLVQVSRVYIDGKARSCRVHDLLCEVLLRRGMESSFCHMLSEHESNFTPVTRRFSIDSSSSDALRSIEQSHIRSVLTFNQEEWPKSFLNTLSGNFKLLKVLDFADAPKYQLPKYMGDLYLLKYLSLRNTKVKLLPDSIGNLQNLETPDLKQCLVYEIPAKIISFLRVKIHDGIGCLQALQKLYHVEANHGGINLIKALGKLRQLRRLGLKNLKSEDGGALCASIEKMNHLESLEVSTLSEDEVLDLQSLSTPPKFIRFLYLKGPLEQLPSWIPQLQQLVKLRIFWSRLRDSPLKALQNLPHLLELGFSYKAYDGVQLHFEGGFEKLRVLKLKDLKGLSSLIIDNGVMPDLQELQIGPSPQLKEVPSGIHHLRNLTTLRFVDMPKEFPRNMDPNDGQHYWVVEHIKYVLFSYKFGPRCGVFETHTLRDSSL